MNTDMNECAFRGDVWTYQCKDRKKVNKRRTDEPLKGLVPAGSIYGCIPRVKVYLCVNLCHQSGCRGGAEARGYHLIVSKDGQLKKTQVNYENCFSFVIWTNLNKIYLSISSKKEQKTVMRWMDRDGCWGKNIMLLHYSLCMHFIQFH